MDSIANALNKIKIASQNGQEKVEIPASKLLVEIIKLLKQEGYLLNYRVIKGLGMGVIRVYLRYQDKKPIITVLKRVSKPGLRIYKRKERLPLVRGGLGTAIITTSKGVMTDSQARADGVGGEVLCYVW